MHKALLLLSIRGIQICESVCRWAIVLGCSVVHKNSARTRIKEVLAARIYMYTEYGKQSLPRMFLYQPRSVFDFVVPV